MRFFECCDCGTLHQREVLTVSTCTVCTGACSELLRGQNANYATYGSGVNMRSRTRITTGMPLSDLAPRKAAIPAIFSQTAYAAGLVALLVVGVSMFATSDRAMAKCQQIQSFDACFETLHR